MKNNLLDEDRDFKNKAVLFCSPRDSLESFTFERILETMSSCILSASFLSAVDKRMGKPVLGSFPQKNPPAKQTSNSSLPQKDLTFSKKKKS
jgi:hypothetical protein